MRTSCTGLACLLGFARRVLFYLLLIAPHLLALVGRWHALERRTVVAVLHDMDQVRQHFPYTLLIAREAIAWGPTQEVLTASNLLKARRMAESWDEEAATCNTARMVA